MPTHIRALISGQHDSMLPRDAVQIAPAFRHQAVLPGDDPNWQTLADDIAAAVNGWRVNNATSQLMVRVYQIGLPAPNRPKAIKVLNPGTSLTAGVAREVALCLSFNGGNNEPHNRGRLYIPWWWATTSSPSVRPSDVQRQKVADLVPLLAGIGGIDVDWGVWSPTRAAFTKAERWYVDDEFDTVRRRGLRSSTRTAGTTGG